MGSCSCMCLIKRIAFHPDHNSKGGCYCCPALSGNTKASLPNGSVRRGILHSHSKGPIRIDPQQTPHIITDVPVFSPSPLPELSCFTFQMNYFIPVPVSGSALVTQTWIVDKLHKSRVGQTWQHHMLGAWHMAPRRSAE